jgi:hypothetical protein
MTFERLEVGRKGYPQVLLRTIEARFSMGGSSDGLI